MSKQAKEHFQSLFTNNYRTAQFKLDIYTHVV